MTVIERRDRRGAARGAETFKRCLDCGKVLQRGYGSDGRLEDLTQFEARKFCSRDCYWSNVRWCNDRGFIVRVQRWRAA